jgi:hypothetical protein
MNRSAAAVPTHASQAELQKLPALEGFISLNFHFCILTEPGLQFFDRHQRLLALQRARTWR